MEVLIGLGAGIVAAVACALFYGKGVKDGMSFKKRNVSFEEGSEEARNELMRKYELIMSYDPYGASEKQ